MPEAQVQLHLIIGETQTFVYYIKRKSNCNIFGKGLSKTSTIISLGEKVLKKIEAIIRREKFPAVDAALKMLGVSGLTVEEVAGRGRARHTTTVLAKGKWDYEEEYIKHLKLEILVQDSNAKGVIDAIMANASTESVGDGKIFVSTIDEVMDIGSKLTDEKAVAFATIP